MFSNPGFPNWRFVEHYPEVKSRDPLQSELLNQESFKPADALVRESIQNSLDARREDASKVRVRLYVSGQVGALSEDEASPYFRDFWPHIEQCVNGGQVAASLQNSPCPFVVIEDFNTVGLTGDVTAARVPTGEPNNFYYFLRAEGMSQKQSTSLGRWGVGKYVFPKSSGVNTFFAYTKRSGDGPALLVGQTVLMNHSLEGTDYDPDGWWAEHDGRLQVPLTDPAVIEETTARWKISRTNETGLSIVIPYVDTALTGRDFVKAVIRAYFGAILAATLEVEVQDATASVTISINAANVMQLAEEYFDGDERAQMVSDIQLLAIRESIPEERTITTSIVAARGDQGWSSTSIDADASAKLRQSLQSGLPVQVVVPFEIRVKGDSGEAAVESTFTVLLQQNESSQQKPLFIRGGIIITDATRSKLTGVRAICIIEEPALTRMLGDAENPAHTTWTANDKIRSRYVRGGDQLTLIKTAPSQIYSLVMDAALEEQRVIFADIFAVPIDEPEAAKKRSVPKRKKSRGSRSAGGPARRGTSPLTQIVKEEAGGFTILPSEQGTADGLKRVEVAVGYETRRGDALAKWRMEDFDLSNFNPAVSGGKIDVRSGNMISAIVEDPESFKLTVLGFDKNRDLHIRARGMSK